MVDVIDPAGLIRSQAIENADGLLRLTLNGAENSRTLAGHFIAESFGSSSPASGASPPTTSSPPPTGCARSASCRLRISPNYYDDLEARFGLAPISPTGCKAADILYDRDEAARILPALQPRLMARVLLRDRRAPEGYAGYGAPNAPFRIAAQKRSMSRAAEGV